jgi:hypothetical protein
MMIEMDMSTGKIDKLSAEAVAEGFGEEFGEFVDEVLNAGWLPQPEARLETHHHIAHGKPATTLDTDEFLRTLYRNQE